MPQSRADIEAEITRLQGELEDATDEEPTVDQEEEDSPEYEDVEAEIRGEITNLKERLDKMEKPSSESEETEEEDEDEEKEEDKKDKKSTGKRKRQQHHRPADEHPWFKRRLGGRI